MRFATIDFLDQGTLTCELIVSFTPEADAAYLATFIYYSPGKLPPAQALGRGFIKAGSCAVEISEIERNAQGEIIRNTPVDVRQRESAPRMYESDPRCQPLN